MKLYSFFNSSTSYRVRIALALKGLEYTYEGVNIRTLANRADEYVRKVNPSAAVPALDDAGFVLGQSMAILDYLDQKYPDTYRLLPDDVIQRARILEFASVISCDIHPINNLRVLRYLQSELKLTDVQRDEWYAHWVQDGLAMAERLLEAHGHGIWCFGNQPTLADCCLVPQLANAERMGCDLSAFPRLVSVYQQAITHEAFQRAQPKEQPDFIT
ncbi:maleylacetoacetate isomerase [Paenalcaligenes hominis]|uniref:Maleylacetoacetate isomerase n=1 Tax=Paenalcaligenes hominis TaxID=643674 RepID=A0ABX0WRB7_9BURK|nr:maleylacetoacetate isomerase [Paenalcaligenes hominis]NJB65305.1 maleylacetoacetate isomerase [Paenalcaligenes hominis]GGE72574.1 maleylacetoacetate isomerase [Paenalcaligenes hominis]